jgi:hypothetical protein
MAWTYLIPDFFCLNVRIFRSFYDFRLVILVTKQDDGIVQGQRQLKMENLHAQNVWNLHKKVHTTKEVFDFFYIPDYHLGYGKAKGRPFYEDLRFWPQSQRIGGCGRFVSKKRFISILGLLLVTMATPAYLARGHGLARNEQLRVYIVQIPFEALAL